MLLDYGLIALVESVVLIWGWETDSIEKELTVCNMLRAYVERYELPDTSLSNHSSYERNGVRLLAYTELLSDAERFVLAHELGHHVLGHLTAAPCQAFPTRVGDIPALSKSVEQEMAADRFAMMVILPAKHDRLKLRQVTAAPFIILGIAQLMEELMPALRQQDSHPTAKVRLDAIQAEFDTAGLFLDRDLGMRFQEWIEGCIYVLRKSPFEIEKLKKVLGD